MVNKKIWLGMLVIVLVFGLTVVGCKNDSTDDDNSSSGGGNSSAKSITITGITGKTGVVELWVLQTNPLLDDGEGGIAYGVGTISNNSVTLPLFSFTRNNPPYTGSGSYCSVKHNQHNASLAF